MGKGDRKTKKGKIRLGSYGKVRPRKKTTVTYVAKTVEKEKGETTKKKAAKKKATTKKTVAKKKVTTKKTTAKKKATAKKTTKKKE